MDDLVLDTCVLGDFLAQYMDTNRADHGHRDFVQDHNLSDEAARYINRLVATYGPGLVVSSTLSFLELVRKWQEIVNDRFQRDQFWAFVRDAPDWFRIEPIDETLLPSLARVPTTVLIDGKAFGVELMDRIHVATALVRGDDARIATTDGVLQTLPMLRGRVV